MGIADGLRPAGQAHVDGAGGQLALEGLLAERLGPRLVGRFQRHLGLVGCLAGQGPLLGGQLADAPQRLGQHAAPAQVGVMPLLEGLDGVDGLQFGLRPLTRLL